MPSIRDLFEELLAKHGQQGWWPLLEQNSSGSWECCYHPGEYQYPDTEEQKLEICLGAILTQNTNWQNTVKALINLKQADLMKPEKLAALAPAELAQLIKSSGYFNQKTRKIKGLVQFWPSLQGRIPSRAELLNIWGIGPETADSILLYAFKMPVMVIDKYTFRVFEAMGLGELPYNYEHLRKTCEIALPENYRVLQEFHALLDAEGKMITLPDKIQKNYSEY
ncbi:MAG: endonuclease III domain-containing protein [Candidatus Cloacimonetes bacterium]|nr:endonuclease III domain-containing protein [Candidatus Cloacimonadota bacterium]